MDNTVENNKNLLVDLVSDILSQKELLYLKRELTAVSSLFILLIHAAGILASLHIRAFR